MEDAIKSVDSGLAALGTNHTQNLNIEKIEAAAVQADQLLSQRRGTFSIEALPQIPVYVVYSPDPDGGADTMLGYATGNLDGIAAYYGDNCKTREIKILAIDEHAVDARIALMSEKTRLGHLLERVTAAHAKFGL